MYLAERPRYVLSHWYDVALILLPMLRPQRLLRLLAFARVLQRSAAGSLVGRLSTYVAGVAHMPVGLGVGYGDFYPVTTTGRLVAVALMLVGIASIGAVTAGVAAWFVTHVAAEHDSGSDRL